jgi:hypothetical protein
MVMTAVVPHAAFHALRRLASRRVEAERCELCGAPLGDPHPHLIEPPTRRLLCACETCAVLFDGGHARYRRVPRDVRALPSVSITAAQWESLRIPIEMAFFYHSSHAGRVVAIYPSPAGATESLLPLETWDDIVAANPPLARMAPDVEALVANRLGRGRGAADEYYLLPIDECFRLVGLIRLHWRGLGGGTDVWREIAAFFSDVRGRARDVEEAIGA